jgi:hypothetical protein
VEVPIEGAGGGAYRLHVHAEVEGGRGKEAPGGVVAVKESPRWV